MKRLIFLFLAIVNFNCLGQTRLEYYKGVTGIKLKQEVILNTFDMTPQNNAFTIDKVSDINLFAIDSIYSIRIVGKNEIIYYSEFDLVLSYSTRQDAKSAFERLVEEMKSPRNSLLGYVSNGAFFYLDSNKIVITVMDFDKSDYLGTKKYLKKYKPLYEVVGKLKKVR